MNFIKTKTTLQLKKWNKLFLGVAIIILSLMVLVVCVSLYQISEGGTSIWLPLSAPIILGPLAFVPLLFSSAISKELKKRNTSNS